MFSQVFQEPQLQLVRQAQAGPMVAFCILGKARPFLYLLRWHTHYLSAVRINIPHIALVLMCPLERPNTKNKRPLLP